jgi:hypothetical protein
LSGALAADKRVLPRALRWKKKKSQKSAAQYIRYTKHKWPFFLKKKLSEIRESVLWLYQGTMEGTF